jgi:uncharacterized damage-inducible protein DinB
LSDPRGDGATATVNGRAIVDSETVERFWPYISRSIERTIEALTSLEEARVSPDWRPPAPQTNSVLVLAVHSLANVEEVLLGVLCGASVVERDHHAEFTIAGRTPGEVTEAWRALQQRLGTQLESIDEANLGSPRSHPRRGQITGYDALLIVARHMAEHAGQAELTRDLALAAHDRAGRRTGGA